MMHNLDQEFGTRRDEPERQIIPGEAQPILGEAQPIPPQRTTGLRLPAYRPRAYLVLLVLNIAIFVVPALLDVLGVQISGFTPSQVVRALGAKNNAAIAQASEYYRFLTAMFLHGGLLHIAFNAFALYSLGPETERIYGTPRFLAIYFLAGFAGGVASYAFTAANSVGASGAIFGLIGALAAFYYTSRKLLGQLARQQLGSLITVIMINLFLGFSVDGIDNFAHIGGLVGGIAVGLLLAPRLAIDEQLYPPEIVRRFLPLSWPGVVGLLVLLIGLVMVVQPPLR